MNEKVKKIFAWIGGILAGFFGLFVFVRSRDHRSGIADAAEHVDESGRAVEDVAGRIGEASGSVEAVKGRVDDVTEQLETVAGRIEDSEKSTDRIATGIDDARQGIAEGIRILDEIEKRNGN